MVVYWTQVRGLMDEIVLAQLAGNDFELARWLIEVETIPRRRFGSGVTGG